MILAAIIYGLVTFIVFELFGLVQAPAPLKILLAVVILILIMVLIGDLPVVSWRHS
jgi:hypothetical protein